VFEGRSPGKGEGRKVKMEQGKSTNDNITGKTATSCKSR
jgi:hypothetical protein